MPRDGFSKVARDHRSKVNRASTLLNIGRLNNHTQKECMGVGFD